MRKINLLKYISRKSHKFVEHLVDGEIYIYKSNCTYFDCE